MDLDCRVQKNLERFPKEFSIPLKICSQMVTNNPAIASVVQIRGQKSIRVTAFGISRTNGQKLLCFRIKPGIEMCAQIRFFDILAKDVPPECLKMIPFSRKRGNILPT